MANGSSASFRAGVSGGKYKASLEGIRGAFSKIDYIGRRGQSRLSNWKEGVGNLASLLEVGSTLAGAWEDKKMLEEEYIPAVEEQKFKSAFKAGDYGLEEGTTFQEFKKQRPVEYGEKFKLYEKPGSIWERLKRDEKMYQFGTDESKSFGKSKIAAAGKYAKGMSDYEDLGFKFKDLGFQKQPTMFAEAISKEPVKGLDSFKDHPLYKLFDKEEQGLYLDWAKKRGQGMDLSPQRFYSEYTGITQ